MPAVSGSRGVPEHRGHILILVENLPVPFDRRTWMEALTLTEAGYKVSVISPAAPDDPVLNRVIEDVHVYRYPATASTKGKLSFLREFAYCFRKTQRIVKRIWREDPFDVIHSCNPPDMFWAIARSYKRHGVKYVFDHHDVCPELYLSKFRRRDLFFRGLCWMERKQYQHADAVIATNTSYRDIALERGGKNLEDVTVVRSGPMRSRFRLAVPDESLKRGRKHLVVYLGVMGPQDGVDYALRSIHQAREQGLDNTSFAFIGDGDCFEELVALSRRLGLETLVEFTGRISDDLLRKYLCTADLGLAPDPKNPLNDISTMNKVVEYMAMGLPVVSFDLRETRQTAGQAAVYVPDNDEKRYARAMIDLLADPMQRQVMSRIGRERFDMHMAWDHSARHLVELYHTLLGHHQLLDPIPWQVAGVGNGDDIRRAA